MRASPGAGPRRSTGWPACGSLKATGRRRDNTPRTKRRTFAEVALFAPDDSVDDEGQHRREQEQRPHRVRHEGRAHVDRHERKVLRIPRPRVRALTHEGRRRFLQHDAGPGEEEHAERPEEQADAGDDECPAQKSEGADVAPGEETDRLEDVKTERATNPAANATVGGNLTPGP